MNSLHDMSGTDDIRTMVDCFYDAVKKDALLAPVFFSRIPGDWEAHLAKMYSFWNAALFGIRGYTGNPFSKHATMEIGPAHFERWLHLFIHTVDTLFAGPVASDAKWRASVMATNFQQRLEDNKGKRTITIV